MKPIYFRIEYFVADYPHMTNRDLQKKYELTEHQLAQMVESLKLKKPSRTVMTPEIAAYIRSNYLKQSGKSMARQFGIDPGVVQRFMRKVGLKVSRELVMKFRYEALAGRTSFSEEEDAYIRENYLAMPIKTLGDKMGRSYTGIMGRIKQMGLIVPPEVIERNKKSSYIKPGNVPINKGKKQSEYMSPEAIARTTGTRFKKGNLPHNTAEGNGEIRIRETKGRPYKHLRVSLGKWILLHKYLWEKKNGPVPSGHCLWAKDGNSLNTDPDNWELITRKENRIRNSGSVNLSDSFVSQCIAKNDPLLREEIKTNHQELIEVKRQQLILSRKIKNHGQKQNNAKAGSDDRA